MTAGRLNTPIGRNDPCWCGAKKKYKHWHLGRANEEPIDPRPKDFV